ncbi:MAG: DsbA family protein [Brevundimonas sp.]|nr:DsbA family protein [Brevundimonas sp.]
MTDTPDQTPAPPRGAGFLSPSRASMAALAVSLLALGLAVAPYATGGDFGGRVRAYLLANPQILDEVIQARDARAESDRTEAVNAAVAANPSALAAGPGEPAFGPVDARVTVVEFFDYRCPYCKTATPAFLALMRTHPDVRFVFKEWPILDQGSNMTSQYAARAALAAHAQGKYLAVHEALMAERALSPESIDRILVANGVELATAREVLASPETSRMLADVYTGATAIGIQGTPTFFVNGRMLQISNTTDIDRAIRAAKAD